ncbi:MAG TPA: NRDE family protein [Eudoraea sp.]|nr:NRDE family protein [Eudoraea sp.]
MCTVSYIPTRKGYLLTSNRDEDPQRGTQLPEKTTLGNGMVITAPRDIKEGGTWIAMDENGRAACLLNGGFLKHIRHSNYRQSRGHFVIEAFEASDFEAFVESVFLRNIEPFTMLLIEPDSILKLVWDGSKKYIWELSPDAVHLWSSSTLYTPMQHAEKEHYFINSLKEKGLDRDQVLQIHGKDADTPFILNHHNVRTVSITQLIYDGKRASLDYYIKNEQNEKTLPHTFILT